MNAAIPKILGDVLNVQNLQYLYDTFNRVDGVIEVLDDSDRGFDGEHEDIALSRLYQIPLAGPVIVKNPTETLTIGISCTIQYVQYKTPTSDTMQYELLQIAVAVGYDGTRDYLKVTKDRYSSIERELEKIEEAVPPAQLTNELARLRGIVLDLQEPVIYHSEPVERIAILSEDDVYFDSEMWDGGEIMPTVYDPVPHIHNPDGVAYTDPTEPVFQAMKVLLNDKSRLGMEFPEDPDLEEVRRKMEEENPGVNIDRPALSYDDWIGDDLTPTAQESLERYESYFASYKTPFQERMASEWDEVNDKRKAYRAKDEPAMVLYNVYALAGVALKNLMMDPDHGAQVRLFAQNFQERLKPEPVAPVAPNKRHRVDAALVKALSTHRAASSPR